jgi:uncharacterized membrane protein YdbT with pleckstrin-like domain
MMRYIDRVLQSGETVVHASKIHWVVYVPAVSILLVGVFALIETIGDPSEQFWKPIFFCCLVVGLIWFFSAWFRRWTTEVDVTDRRIVYKRGFVWRHTVEMNMDKVESVDVDQSILGRILNYGNITIRGTGIGLEPLRSIEAPLEFRNHVTAR